MHMQGEPRTMQAEPQYDDVAAEVASFLEERLAFAVAQGIPEERICLDPGIGFGKTVEHNLELVRRLDVLLALGRPVLVGFSRKSSLRRLTGSDDLLGASVAAAVAAFERGATILRVHDVRPTVDALDRRRRNRVITVEVRDLRVFGRHGVHEDERERGQDFLFDVELEVGERGTSDRLEDAVDYVEVARAVQDGLGCEAVRPARGARVGGRRRARAALLAGAGARARPEARGAARGARRHGGSHRHETVTRAYVGLGANLGDRERTLRAAVDALGAEEGIDVVAVSTLRDTEPVGVGEQPRFLNGVVSLETTLSARALLDRLLEIEQRFGRVRVPGEHGPRTLDLDLLLYGDEEIDEPGLTVPHPRLHDRRFVLEPLAELAPGLVVPGRGDVESLLRGVH